MGRLAECQREVLLGECVFVHLSCQSWRYFPFLLCPLSPQGVLQTGTIHQRCEWVCLCCLPTLLISGWDLMTVHGSLAFCPGLGVGSLSLMSLPVLWLRKRQVVQFVTGSVWVPARCPLHRAP
jgi:hypothetical protein